MFKSIHNTPASSWGPVSTLGMIALDEALSAYNPNPRSPAFAVKEIFQILTEGPEQPPFSSRLEFLGSFSSIQGCLYKGRMSWDDSESCWQMKDGKTIDAHWIEEDAIRWYLQNRDFSRHTRDPRRTYPEDVNFGPTGVEEKLLYDALMPHEDELTRRTIMDEGGRLGYLDVYREKTSDEFTAVMGFFSTPSYHGFRKETAPFWKLEANVVPALLRGYLVKRYDVLIRDADREK